jgi:glycosyltransferase involved in cell wall biosynthesis
VIRGGPGDAPTRVLRVIARLNVGGPAYHVSILSGMLDARGYQTLLVAGRVGRGEASFDDLARRYGARLELLESLRPEIHPIRDLRALLALIGLIRRFRPDIVHTHTAKAGMLGRLAAVIGAGRRRPIVVHTYHGHVLEGYFGAAKTGLYRFLERALARVSDRLIGVSQATVDDLVRLRVAPPAKFEVVPLGLDLERFLAVDEAAGRSARQRLELREDDLVLLYVGRLVPIKRVDRLLRVFAAAARSLPGAVLLVAGDGELRASLERAAGELGIAPQVRFLGFRDDLDVLLAASDIGVLTSDNEGTPVFLIEAAAAARPAIATDVGGVRDVVRGDGGIVVAADDEAAFAAAIAELASGPEERLRMGSAAREHVAPRYARSRLLDDVDSLYRTLLGERGAAR